MRFQLYRIKLRERVLRDHFLWERSSDRTVPENVSNSSPNKSKTAPSFAAILEAKPYSMDLLCLTDHFSDPDRAVGWVCVCVCPDNNFWTK